METLARKPDIQYEERRMTIEQYASFKGWGVSTVRRYIDRGLLSDKVEQIAKNYPITIIAKVRVQ